MSARSIDSVAIGRRERRGKDGHHEGHGRERRAQTAFQHEAGEQGAQEARDAKSEEHAGNRCNASAGREFKKRPQVGEEGEMSNENQHGADHADGDTRVA